MKRTETLDVFHEETNFVVLQMPNRAYPGVLIQGDSLLSILGELDEAITHFDSDREESLGCLQNAFDELKWRVDGYQRCAKATIFAELRSRHDLLILPQLAFCLD